MPTIAVDKAALFKELGQSFTTDGFQDLCFDFGVELDEDTEDDPNRDGPPELKIEIPANRYDMLCIEGISEALNIFRGKQATPKYDMLKVAKDKMQTITVHKDVERVRPYVAGAILRGVKFTQARYDSFISLQDKLHQNLARQRTLVSIGTHDLATVKGPFTYEALPPKDINFIPLNQTKKMSGEELMTFYETDKHLGKFLHIIRDKDVYPVIFDANKVVCSLPPIINGEHSKITLNTTDVFIEITAKDQTKLAITLDIVVAMFSRYCAKPFQIEPVKIISEHNGCTRITPSLVTRVMDVDIPYLNRCCGLSLKGPEICQLLTKMAHKARPKDEHTIEVAVPPTRADILHACDVMEDLAIAYGFNALPRISPNKSVTIGQPLPINQLSDVVRNECAMAGWVEALPLILCSRDENFKYLNRKEEGENLAVHLANPKTAEYQVCRTSLLPGILKTIASNKAASLPLMLFEVSDVVFKDESRERRARNRRKFAAAYVGKTSGFEIVHGLLDRVMAMLRAALVTHEEGLSGKGEALDPKKGNGYYIQEAADATFFPGRAAAIYLRLEGKSQRIGELGVLHPTVLANFGLDRYPISTLEIDLEVFL